MGKGRCTPFEARMREAERRRKLMPKQERPIHALMEPIGATRREIEITPEEDITLFEYTFTGNGIVMYPDTICSGYRGGPVTVCVQYNGADVHEFKLVEGNKRLNEHFSVAGGDSVKVYLHAEVPATIGFLTAQFFFRGA